MSLAVVETEPPFDEAAAEAFAERAGETINAGAIAVMMSIGHRTGLFDVMASLPSSTSHQIADAARLSERYVREWLAVMVTGGIVIYEPAGRTYVLPVEHAACLTRNAALGNLAVYAQAVPLMGSLQDHILECFASGEGTAYDDYPHFHDFMSEDSDMTVVAQLFDVLLPLVPGLHDRLEAGIDVLDAGCARGHALLALAELYPRSRFTGYDLCEDAIADAQQAVQERELTNIRFEQRDLTGYAEKDRFDFVTSFDAVHDQKDPQDLLTGLYGALRSGGVYLMQDIGGSAHLENNMDFPMASMLYAVSCTHCMPISLGQGGEGLGTMWGHETAQAMLEAAGFTGIEKHVLPDDPMNVWFVSRKG